LAALEACCGSRIVFLRARVPVAQNAKSEGGQGGDVCDGKASPPRWFVPSLSIYTRHRHVLAPHA